VIEIQMLAEYHFHAIATVSQILAENTIIAQHQPYAICASDRIVSFDLST
jgi:hypothetical protein